MSDEQFVDPELHELLQERAKWSATKDLTEIAIKDLNQRIIPIMLAHDLKTYKEQGVGTMTYVEGSSTTLNKDKLKKALLSRGIAADVIAAAIAEATSMSTYVTVQFKKDRIG